MKSPRTPPFSDSPTLNAMVENARKIKMTPDQQLYQSLDFAYGNLACSSNHKPNREAFKTLAMERGMSASEFESWADKREWIANTVVKCLKCNDTGSVETQFGITGIPSTNYCRCEAGTKERIRRSDR